MENKNKNMTDDQRKTGKSMVWRGERKKDGGTRRGKRRRRREDGKRQKMSKVERGVVGAYIMELAAAKQMACSASGLCIVDF